MKIIIGLLILCGTYSTYSASLSASQSSPCSGQPDGWMSPVPGDCSEFYICLNGQESVLTCGTDIHFDPLTKTCILASKSKCMNGVRSDEPKSEPEKIAAPKSICAGKAIGAFVPSKTSCSEYYTCIGTNPLLKKCPVGFHFFPETRSCIEENLSNCVIKSKETVKVEEKKSPISVKVEEKKEPEPVKVEEKENPKAVKTDKKENSKPVKPSLTKILADEVCLGQTNGAMFPIPGSCSKYFSCLKNKAYTKSCGPRHFDPTRKSCIKPESSTCVEGEALENLDVVIEALEEAVKDISHVESDLISKVDLNEQQKIQNVNIIEGDVKSVESQKVSSDANSDTNTDKHTISEGKLIINNKKLPLKKAGLPVFKKAEAAVQNADVDVNSAGVIINTAGVHSNHGSARDAEIDDASVESNGKGINIGSNVDLSSSGDISGVDIVTGSNSVGSKHSNEVENTKPKNAYIEAAKVEPEEVDEEPEVAKVESEEAHIEPEVAIVESEESPIVKENTELVIAVIDEDSADACVGILSGSLLPRVGSCQQFLTCENGVAFIGKCPRGLHFNPIAKFCDWPDKAGCI